MVLGVDVGGTFTDLAWWDGHGLRVGKVATTPSQSDGVVSGASELLAGAQVTRLLHGTTVATNALLERKGARVVLAATNGFVDLTEIGRQDRPSLYDSFADRPTPLVPRSLRVTVDGRVGPGGDELAPLEAIDDAVLRISALSPEAVAVSLLHAYANPDHEQALSAALRSALPDVPVSLSSDVAREFREFERASTAVLNAYLAPVTAGYVGRLQRAVAEAGVADSMAVMRSSGGLVSAAAAARFPASILLSGPAGGVVAAAELGRALGRDRIISFDMGGTSTDVCRIDGGRPEVAYERPIEGYPCRMPAVAVHTVGAGGGSVAWVDAGGSLRVGPQSAGSYPGPAGYGRGGTEPTVTDANLLLGRLDPGSALAGSLVLDRLLAEGAVGSVAEPLGLSARDAASGVVAVVEAHMARALRAVSVEEGSDPRDAHLVAFGGAGGLHATALARSLGMAGVIVPPYAGVFSAVGLLLSSRRADAAQTVLLRAGDEAALAPALGQVGSAAAQSLAETAPGVAGRVRYRADVRYVGQAHETVIDVEVGLGWPGLASRFHEAHRERNGFARPDDPVEVVTVRAEAVAPPALRFDQLPEARPHGTAHRGERQVWTGRDQVAASLWWREALAPGTEIAGPAIVEESESTTYLAPDERAIVHDSGSLEVEW